MKKVASGRIAAVCMMLTCICTAAYGQTGIIQVHIELMQSAVKNNERFTVPASLSNTSNDAASLQVWSCSFPEQWVSDNPTVHIPAVPCEKNDAIWIKLSPGESFTEQLAIYIALPADHRAREPVDFRLGFEPIDFQRTATPSIIWSNAVTINVIE
jgi:hypothetical protein